MKDLLASSVVSTCIALIVVLAVLHFAPVSDILISHSQYVPAREIKELDAYEQLVIERMIREKTLISVDTLWSLQVSFYQTMVSILIALNAAIVGGAFVIIRSSSRAEVVKESKAHFDEFSSTGGLAKIVERKAKKELNKLNAIYGDLFDGLSEQDVIVSDHEARIKLSEDAIIQVSSRLAELDKAETCASRDVKITE
ncbi:hypothetical protein RYB69_00695 [Pseudomonas syringae]|nr:hypothetical protein [Pseudomonas syringae]